MPTKLITIDDLLKSLENDQPCRDIDLYIMRWIENIGGAAENALPYTSCITAAVTLIPKEMQWSYSSHYKIAYVYDYPFDPQGGPYEVKYLGEGSTAAMSICIAAIKARMKDE